MRSGDVGELIRRAGVRPVHSGARAAGGAAVYPEARRLRAAHTASA